MGHRPAQPRVRVAFDADTLIPDFLSQTGIVALLGDAATLKGRASSNCVSSERAPPKTSISESRAPPMSYRQWRGE
jgi:hypothetical protein